MEIMNRKAVIEQLTEILMQFDKDCNQHQTDVYLYIKEDQTAKLDTFINVGGNSWINDEHYTIYSDKEHYDDGVFGWIQDKREFAEILEIPQEQLDSEVRKFYKANDNDGISYSEYEQYLKHNDSYMEKLKSAYDDTIEEQRPDYAKTAEDIIEKFEENF